MHVKTDQVDLVAICDLLAGCGLLAGDADPVTIELAAQTAGVFGLAASATGRCRHRVRRSDIGVNSARRGCVTGPGW